MTETIARFEDILHTLPQRLIEIPEAAATYKPDPDRWSKKEILGHLIDSASNNHQRFVRAQFTARLEFPEYEQKSWVKSQRTPGAGPDPHLWLSIATCCMS